MQSVVHSLPPIGNEPKLNVTVAAIADEASAKELAAIRPAAANPGRHKCNVAFFMSVTPVKKQLPARSKCHLCVISDSKKHNSKLKSHNQPVSCRASLIYKVISFSDRLAFAPTQPATMRRDPMTWEPYVSALAARPV